ncbi:hypothetical protein [Streptomyces sp. NPDC057280]|uniref:hypothetical protein n=1 Tax=Streptomyces sp. NPDC057280 TaxID=3346081 RepID=UPI003636B88B
MKSRKTKEISAEKKLDPPFLEIRAGGFYMSVQAVPYKLITAAGALAGVASGMTWFIR